MRITADQKNATRKKILGVAEKQFAEHGFEATTTRDIARASRIAVGTLFNYFPTKEAIVEALAMDGYQRATTQFAASFTAAEEKGTSTVGGSLKCDSLEEELFGYIALILRKLKPLRKYLSCLLETSLSPLALQATEETSLRAIHLATVSETLARHGGVDVSPTALHLYWTLYIGVLAYWATDSSPRQEDTLALLDESMAMFVAWMSTTVAARQRD